MSSFLKVSYALCIHHGVLARQTALCDKNVCISKKFTMVDRSCCGIISVEVCTGELDCPDLNCWINHFEWTQSSATRWGCHQVKDRKVVWKTGPQSPPPEKSPNSLSRMSFFFCHRIFFMNLLPDGNVSFSSILNLDQLSIALITW